MLGIREKLDYQWGQPDLFFTCLLEPLESEQINIQHPEEIRAAEWLDITELHNLNMNPAVENFYELLKDVQR